MKPPIDLDILQTEIAQWKLKNFPDSPDWHQMIGAGEEIGELALGVCELAAIYGKITHAFLKHAQSIRGTPEELQAKMKDAVGDAFVYMLSLCSMRGWSANEILTDTWNTVKRRDWQKNKQDGGELSSEPMCPVCAYPIPLDKLVRVQSVPVHIACAGTYARTKQS